MGGSSGLAGRMLRRCRRAGGDIGVGLVLLVPAVRVAGVGAGVGVGGGGGGAAGNPDAMSDGGDDDDDGGTGEECRDDEKSESFGRLIRDGISATACLGLQRACFTLRCTAARG